MRGRPWQSPHETKPSPGAWRIVLRPATDRPANRSTLPYQGGSFMRKSLFGVAVASRRLTPQSSRATDKRVKGGVLAGILSLISLGSLCCSPKSTSELSSPKPNRSSIEKRLFLQNDAQDEEARKEGFRTILKGGGHRCDAVTKATMRMPGNWAVLCEPGGIYTLSFDSKGQVSSTTKAQ